MLVSGIDRRLSCTVPQHVSTTATMRHEMATQSRRESPSEVHAH
jgi:hypothetical protein